MKVDKKKEADLLTVEDAAAKIHDERTHSAKEILSEDPAIV